MPQLHHFAEVPHILGRSFERWERVQGEPLGDQDAAYIVSGDVSAFYQYVDHGLLGSEIVSQTGDAEVAEAVVGFLHGILQRRVGLPQSYLASDLLADLLIDIAERRLLRQGYRVWRSNDDFRIACATRREAREAIEALDIQVRRLGLTLNEAKTFSQTRERYNKHLLAPSEAWDPINTAIDFEFRGFDPYSELVVADFLAATEDEPDDEDAQLERDKRVAAAETALVFWSERPTGEGAEDEPAPRRVYRRLVSVALQMSKPRCRSLP